MKRLLLLLLMGSVYSTQSFGQGVVISTSSGATPDASAMLDIHR